MCSTILVFAMSKLGFWRLGSSGSYVYVVTYEPEHPERRAIAHLSQPLLENWMPFQVRSLLTNVDALALHVLVLKTVKGTHCCTSDLHRLRKGRKFLIFRPDFASERLFAVLIRICHPFLKFRPITVGYGDHELSHP